MSEEYWETEEQMTAELVAAGCVLDLYEEDGEVIITWNMDRLEELYPKVFEAVREAHLEEIRENLNSLISKGLVEVNPIINADGTIEEEYSLTTLGREVAEQELTD